MSIREDNPKKNAPARSSAPGHTLGDGSMATSGRKSTMPDLTTAKTNASFLRAMFGSAMMNAYVTAFTEDPTGDYPLGVRGRMWGGGTYAAKKDKLTSDANQYVCVSTFNASRDPEDHGRPRRQRALFNRCYSIMVDDIGTKVNAKSIKLKPFTALVETSPGNYQGWYALKADDADAADPALVDYVVDQMIEKGLAKVDPGMKGVTRYGRLPGGVNNKGKLGKPFKVKMEELNAKQTYTLREVAKAYGINVDDAVIVAPRPSFGARIVIPENEREKYALDLLTKLEEAGCEPSEHPNKPGGYDILCPWRDTHTGGDTTGTMLFVPGYTDPSSHVEFILGGYKCHHGHCQDKRLRDVLGWLNTEHAANIVHPSWLAFPPMAPERTLGDAAGVVANPETGVPKKIQHNLDVILRNDPLYASSSAFQVAWDTFGNETYIGFESDTVDGDVHLRAPGRGIPAALSLSVQLDIFRVHRVDFAPAMIDRALEGWLYENRFDSAMEWAEIQSKRWDGTARLDQWLVEIGGAKDNAYVRAVSRLVLLAAAKRAMSPGFKFDNMLILEGKQGTGKSSMLQLLCPKPEWYASIHFDVQNKDSVADSIGKMVIEFEELQSLKRSDQNAMKGFLSRTSDRVRLPYERMSADYPRRGVFIGTTNNSAYLVDITGNRRYWPVYLYAKKVNFKAVEEMRDQLWAEACAVAKKITKPEELSLPDDLAVIALDEAEKRNVSHDDPWFTAVEALIPEVLDTTSRLHPEGFIFASRLLERLGVPVAAQTNADGNRLGALLRARGYERKKARWNPKSEPCWGWVMASLT